MDMINSLRSSRRCLLMGVACGLAMVALASSQARAGTLEILISEGGTTYDILDQSPLDNNPAVNAIQQIAGSLVFPDYTINALTAVTNNPGTNSSIGAFLTVTGDVTRSTSGGAPALTILVTDTDYTLPTGPKTMGSSASGTFTNVPLSDTQTFQSWFNPNNTPFAKQTGSALLTLMSTDPVVPNSHGADAPVIPVGTASLYGLTNQTVITLSALGAEVGFSGSTKILAIPEPTSLAIMLPALPVVIMGWLRHRKARAATTS